MHLKSTFKILLILLLGFFTVLMINITIPYFAFDDNVAFLRIKQWIIHNDIWKGAFYTHVITSCFCLLAGFTQFSGKVLHTYPKVHRTMGWLYVGVILLFSGPSGLVMSVYANGGILSQIAFITLSILWIFFTYKGFKTAVEGHLSAHRKFMIRSYALTLSALTLRAWKLVIVLAFRPQPMDVYMLVAWLGWVPNLLIAEWYIRGKFKHFKLIFK